MKNMYRTVLIIGLICAISMIANAADKFDLIKNKIDSSAAVYMEVLITIESKIFGDVDSTYAKIILAKNGCYRVELGSDIYLFDGSIYWEYSAENGQATKRRMKPDEIHNNQLAFFKNLDKFYNTLVLKENSVYKLIKKSEADESLLDSMTVTLDKEKTSISEIEYFDINDDRNNIFVINQSFEFEIGDNLFELYLPESTEIILLP